MPLYNSPLVPPQLLQKGAPAYFFGSLNMLQGNTKGTVSNVASTAGTGTVTVQINEGPLPFVGDLITVWGTSAGGGAFNTNRAVITDVTIDPATGSGTISYTGADPGVISAIVVNAGGASWDDDDGFTIAGGTGGTGSVATQTGGAVDTVTLIDGGYGYSDATGAATTAILPSVGTGLTVDVTAGGDFPSTDDGGMFLVEAGEMGETLTTGTFSRPITVQAPQGDSQFTLPFAVTCPSMPEAAVFTLQRAIRDIDSEYTDTTAVITIATSAFSTGPCIEVTLERAYVYRVAVTNVSGGSDPTVCAKVG